MQPTKTWQPKQFEKCMAHPGKDRTYIDVVNKRILCENCIIQMNVDIKLLRRADEYCAEALQRWKQLKNWSRYLESEHDQKEKEWGIPWRSAFKQVINATIEDLKSKEFANIDLQDKTFPNQFEALKYLISLNCEEVEKHCAMNKADMVQLMQDNFTCLQKYIQYLKAILKVEEQEKFEQIKHTVFSQ